MFIRLSSFSIATFFVLVTSSCFFVIRLTTMQYYKGILILKNIIKLFLKYFFIQNLNIHLHQLNIKTMDENKKPVGRPKEQIKKIAVTITKYYYPIELKQKGGSDAVRLRMREACRKI